MLHCRNEEEDIADFYQPGDSLSGSNPSNCCRKLRISNTTNTDEWYQSMMGEFQLFKPMSYMEYLKKGDLSGRYPVYLHKFNPWTPRKERIFPPRVFLYYYVSNGNHTKRSSWTTLAGFYPC